MEAYPAVLLGGLFGGWISRWIPAPRLVLLSAGMATVAASTMLLPLGHGETGLTQPPFQVSLALALGLVVGALIGLVGTGAFLLIPVQVYLLRMPTRTAIATSLSAGFPTALAALAGKALAGQVPWFATLVVCLPALPGAQLGSALAAHLPARVLRMVYALVIAMVAAVLWYDVLHTP